MQGQWIGPYAGTNNGTMVVDLDDGSTQCEGSAFAIDHNVNLPPTYGLLRAVPKDQAAFSMRVQLFPVDRQSGTPAPWDELKKYYPPTVTAPQYADTEWKVHDKTIEISWRTDINTHGQGVIYKSRSSELSELAPLPEIQTWDDFRRFARDLEPFSHVFRGQNSNQWRLRTSFHRTNRSSLIRYMFQDIPTLYRHMSGLTRHHFELGDPLQNAAFYNLVQHHGFPTPLLDWTYSPFIAAYFAYKGAKGTGVAADERVRIFVLDKVRWCQDFESVGFVMPPKLHFTVLEPLAMDNPRVVPQQSVSSVTNVDDIEWYLMQSEKRVGKTYLRAIDLPASQRNEVMEELALTGITAGSLFPGIDGACEQLRERFFGI